MSIFENSGLSYLRNVTSLKLIEEKCIGCGMCETVCPHRVFSIYQGKATIKDPDHCIECGACNSNCPVAAIEVKAGVGCASAIIHSWLTGKEPSCDCGGGSSC